MSVDKKEKPAVSLFVVLDNPSKVYFSGEMITGFVKFNIEDCHKILLLSVNLNAEYYCIKGDHESVEVIYSTMCPLDLKSAGEGNSEMPFSLVVRPDSPTSLASSLGGIRYRVVSALGFKETDKVHSLVADEMVSVNAQEQLKDNTAGLKASAQEGWNVLSCCGSLSADFEVACVGILCGHSAIINACIKNGTNSHVQGTSVSLVQKIVRQRDKKTTKCTVATKERGGIQPGKRQVWLSDRFLIPPLPPSSNNSYFKVSYSFVMVVQKTSTKGMHLKIPIVIGNLPRDEDTLLSNTQCSEVADMEGRCSHLPSDVTGFKPLYVTYIS